MRFHPFQGRPSFGRIGVVYFAFDSDKAFPSLSGKTFIRTLKERKRSIKNKDLVSIPFREDLHSDPHPMPVEENSPARKFPSLSGKTFIRTPEIDVPAELRGKEFPSLSGKTFIRT